MQTDEVASSTYKRLLEFLGRCLLKHVESIARVG